MTHGVDGEPPTPQPATPTDGLLLRVLDGLHDVRMDIEAQAQLGVKRDRDLRAMCRAVRAVTGRMDKLDLNGSAKKLKDVAEQRDPLVTLAASAPALLELAAKAPDLVKSIPTDEYLAYRRHVTEQLPVMDRFIEVAPKVLQVMDDRAEWAITWKRIRILLKPTRLVGLLIWTFICGVLWAVGSELVAALQLFHH